MNYLLLAVSLGLSAANPVAAAPVDYLREVKPLLAKYCVSCHGANRPRGGLRLDTARLAIQGGKAGPAIIAGHADESVIIDAMLGEGAIERNAPETATAFRNRKSPYFVPGLIREQCRPATKFLHALMKTTGRSFLRNDRRFLRFPEWPGPSIRSMR